MADMKKGSSGSRWRIWLIVVLIFIGISAFFYLRMRARATYATAHDLYLDAECGAALTHYDRLRGYPDFLLADPAAVERQAAACRVYDRAVAVAANSPSQGIDAFEAFLADYPDMPLTWRAQLQFGDSLLATAIASTSETTFRRALDAYEGLASQFPGELATARQRHDDAYLSYGRSLEEEPDQTAARAFYAVSLSDDPAQFSEPQTLDTMARRLRDLHHAYNQELRADGEYEAALEALDSLSAASPTMAEDELTTLIVDTAVEYAGSLVRDGDHIAALEVLERLEARSEATAVASLEPRSATLLAMARDLRDRGQFQAAQEAYLEALSVEHVRLAPLTDSGFASPLPYPNPFALVTVEQSSSIRIGPGTQYDVAANYPAHSAERPLALIGMSPNGDWAAVASPGQTVSTDGERGPLHATAWADDGSLRLFWLPIDELTFLDRGSQAVPLEPKLISRLAASSAIAADAVRDLQGVWSDWAESARNEGDFQQAADSLAALQRLAPDTATRDAALAALAQLYLEAAESSASSGNSSISIEYAWLAIDYDQEQAITAEAQRVLSDNYVALGAQAEDAADYAATVNQYEQALQLERELYVQASGTVTDEDLTLLSEPELNAVIVDEAQAGISVDVIGRQQNDAGDWLLLLWPRAEGGRAWALSSGISLPSALNTFAALPLNAVPQLNAHEALQGLARAHEAWAEAARAEGAYETALEQYEILLDPAFSTVVTDIEPQAADTLASLAESLWVEGPAATIATAQDADPNGELGILSESSSLFDDLTVIITYARDSIATAPESNGAVRATELLVNVLAFLETQLGEDGNCAPLAPLELLRDSILQQSVDQALPDALYQCAVAKSDQRSFSRAFELLERIVDEYPNSVRASQARAEIPLVSWKAEITARGMSTAAEEVCGEASTFAQAGVGSLHTPVLPYVSGTYWASNPSGQVNRANVTAVVCVGPELHSTVETCRYTDGSTITRHRTYVDVRVVNPVSQLTVATQRFYGESPRTCPFIRTSSSNLFLNDDDDIYGRAPDKDEIDAWLRQILPGY